MPPTTGVRLCIDGIPLLVRGAGIKNYLFHWIIHLRRVSGTCNVRLFPYLAAPRELDHERSLAGPYGTFGRLALLHLLNLRENHLLDWIQPTAHIFHSTKLLNPPRRSRLTATLYDATCWLMPEFHTAANVAAEKRFAERIWQRASGLIAISENTRNDLVRLLGLDVKRIQVIYPGIAEMYFEVHPTEAQLVRQQYGLDRNYVLFVGAIEPRKNLMTLLDAYESLPSEIREEFDLVIAGPMGWLAHLVARRLENSTSNVRYLGYIPESAMPGLFAGATVFTYVSLYEGFGFPVAQALAAGVPVLTSATSSLPEVAGGAAEMVDPRSTEEVRAALYRLLTSPSRRSSLLTAGRGRAERFRWDTCARESMRFFERVAGQM